MLFGSLVLLLATARVLASPTSPPPGSLRRRAVTVNDNTTSAAAATGLTSTKINLIRHLLDTTANKSWEQGTVAETYTEFDYPSLSPFFSTFVPVPSSPSPYSVLNLINPILAAKPASQLQLVQDGSAADPASIGPAVILANWTTAGQSNVSSLGYAEAVDGQLRALLQDTPRTDDGAISHRVEEVALWSDFVYMVPPFLAYYGVVNGNTSLIQMAYDQCRLYRQYLRTPETGLWRHILWGSNPDDGLWATGNGWAAAGMMRVLATILHSDYASEYTGQTTNLTNWIIEIVDASFALQASNHLFHNYLNETNTFTDAASAALLVSVSYRLAQLKLSTSTLDKAEATRPVIYRQVNSRTGVLSPVVDPLSYGNEGSESPEGQAFVLLMESAWRDWRAMSDTPGGGGGVANATDETSAAGRLSQVGRGGGYWSTMALLGLVAVGMLLL